MEILQQSFQEVELLHYKEAFDAAKNGDFSKLEEFKEKIDKISEHYKDKPKIIPLDRGMNRFLDMPCGGIRWLQLVRNY